MIIRIQKHDNPFVQIDKRPLSDERLSWKARGLLAYLLSKPDKWEVNISDLVNRSQKDGRESVQAGLKELRALGYADLVTTREKGKLTGKSWVIRELPTDGKPGYREATDERVSRRTVLPTDGESTTSNNEYSSNNEKKRETPSLQEKKEITLTDRFEQIQKANPDLPPHECRVLAAIQAVGEYLRQQPIVLQLITNNLKHKSRLGEKSGKANVLTAEVEKWVKWYAKDASFMSDLISCISSGRMSLGSWLSRWDNDMSKKQEKEGDNQVYKKPVNVF